MHRDQSSQPPCRRSRRPSRGSLEGRGARPNRVISPRKLVIRDAHQEDRDAVSALLIGAYAQYMPASLESISPTERAGWEGYRQNIADVWSRAPISSTIVAERDGKLLGSVNYYGPGRADSSDNTWPPEWASIRLLGVSPEARGLGIGRALMDECLRRARAHRAGGMGFHTTWFMGFARAGYLRRGFKRVPAPHLHPTPDLTAEAHALELT